MVNPGEVLLKAVMFVKPKLLIGLDQKGKWPGAGSQRFPATDVVPPAERHDLNPAASMKVNEVSPQPSHPHTPLRRTAFRKKHPWGGGSRMREQANADRNGSD